jgi:dephospho-CoA kinase
MIIGLAGQKESGKDTVAAYLVKKYRFERRAFADPLKRSVAALLEIPFHEVDQFKLDEHVFVSVGYKNQALPIVHEVIRDYKTGGERLGKQISPNAMWSPIREMTFRQFLQHYGTESHRDVFGVDFWLDHTLPVNGYYPGRNIAITDVRFDNEAERIKRVEGYVIEIKRPNLKSDTHVSEQIDFDTDYVLYNDGTLDDLWSKIEDMLSWAADQIEI